MPTSSELLREIFDDRNEAADYVRKLKRQKIYKILSQFKFKPDGKNWAYVVEYIESY